MSNASARNPTATEASPGVLAQHASRPFDPPLQFNYDAQTDVLTVEGVKITGALFRSWAAYGMPLGTWFQLMAREDGTIVIRKYDSPADALRELGGTPPA